MYYNSDNKQRSAPHSNHPLMTGPSVGREFFISEPEQNKLTETKVCLYCPEMSSADEFIDGVKRKSPSS